MSLSTPQAFAFTGKDRGRGYGRFSSGGLGASPGRTVAAASDFR